MGQDIQPSHLDGRISQVIDLEVLSVHQRHGHPAVSDRETCANYDSVEDKIFHGHMIDQEFRTLIHLHDVLVRVLSQVHSFQVGIEFHLLLVI